MIQRILLFSVPASLRCCLLAVSYGRGTPVFLMDEVPLYRRFLMDEVPLYLIRLFHRVEGGRDKVFVELPLLWLALLWFHLLCGWVSGL